MSLKIGMIGLDTSHVQAFAELLNDSANPHHVRGGVVVAAYPGGSMDWPLSFSRTPKFARVLADIHKVQIVDAIADLETLCDVIMLESADGRVHLSQFRQIVAFGKPVFVDKPLAANYGEAREIVRLAKTNNIPLMSSSALRFATSLQAKLANPTSIRSVDCFGPMFLEPPLPRYSWYGIHTAEILFAALGQGCQEVRVHHSGDHEIIIGRWRDDRVGTIHGIRHGHNEFGAVIHGQDMVELVNISQDPIPFYASLLQKVMDFFACGQSPVSIEETLEIMAFLDAAEISFQENRWVSLGEVIG